MRSCLHRPSARVLTTMYTRKVRLREGQLLIALSVIEVRLLLMPHSIFFVFGAED